MRLTLTDEERAEMQTVLLRWEQQLPLVRVVSSDTTGTPVL
jgi:hypothetical protein